MLSNLSFNISRRLLSSKKLNYSTIRYIQQQQHRHHIHGHCTKRFKSSNTAARTATSSYNSNNASKTKALHDRNTRAAIYLASAVIGALGATYASVPLYKLFCQKTGFGGTTQRVRQFDDEIRNDNSNNNPNAMTINVNIEQMDENGDNKTSLLSILERRLIRSLDWLYDVVNNAGIKTVTNRRMGKSHGANTWTDEEEMNRLSTLKPVADGRLLRIYFTTNTSSVLPWSFEPTQSSIKVIPGETALSFFTAVNNSNKPITGVATYNVHPAKAGLYFNKIQCFCFEEQRLLPGETVDMPVFFYIDPEFMDDPYMDRVNSITLSYTFFKTDEDEEEEEEE